MNYIIYYDYYLGSHAMCQHDYFTEDKLPIQLLQADSFKEAYSEFISHCPDGKVPVIYIEPMTCACVTFIYPELIVYQRLVGGLIEYISDPIEDTAEIICNDEGKVMQLRLNRALRYDGKIFDVVSGNMIIIFRGKDDDIVILEPEKIERVYEYYKEPEVFYLEGEDKRINAIKCNPDLANLLRENNISLINRN